MLGLVAIAVVSSFRSVGTLLVFGLLIAPSATASLVVRRVPTMMVTAAAIGVLSVTVGLIISFHYDTAAGATMAGIAVLHLLHGAGRHRAGGGAATPAAGSHRSPHNLNAVMTTDAVTLLLALLTVASWGASVVLVAAHVAPRLRPRVSDLLAGQVLPLAFLVAAISMAGSLYLSEVAHFPPCRLCWFQRIAMYPQVLLLGVAWYRRDEGIRHYVLPLSVIGALISTYHLLLERFPSLEGSSGCDPANPCTIRWVEQFGFITIPTMALSAFVLIALLMTHLPSTPADEAEPENAEPTRTEVP